MLKEEKDFRKRIRHTFQDSTTAKRYWLGQITALVRAIRRDEEAKRVEEYCVRENAGVLCEACMKEAAAIREKK